MGPIVFHALFSMVVRAGCGTGRDRDQITTDDKHSWRHDRIGWCLETPLVSTGRSATEVRHSHGPLLLRRHDVLEQMAWACRTIGRPDRLLRTRYNGGAVRWCPTGQCGLTEVCGRWLGTVMAGGAQPDTLAVPAPPDFPDGTVDQDVRGVVGINRPPLAVAVRHPDAPPRQIDLGVNLARENLVPLFLRFRSEWHDAWGWGGRLRNRKGGRQCGAGNGVGQKTCSDRLQ